MSYWYEGRRFRSVRNSNTGEVTGETFFDYHQQGPLVWAEYSGGLIALGHLLATVDAFGILDARYQHVNTKGDLMTGVCRTTPERLADGRYRLHESWQWTCGFRTSGESMVEEVV